jgi:hypothetical protein
LNFKSKQTIDKKPLEIPEDLINFDTFTNIPNEEKLSLASLEKSIYELYLNERETLSEDQLKNKIGCDNVNSISIKFCQKCRSFHDKDRKCSI